MRGGNRKLQILSGWKDIANYLGRGVRTVQRYERELSLPVRRPANRFRGAVIATKRELDAWVAASPIRQALHSPQPTLDNTALFNSFKRNVEELSRLREKTTLLSQEWHASLELMRGSFRHQIASSKRCLVADVLTFDLTRQKNPLIQPFCDISAPVKASTR